MSIGMCFHDDRDPEYFEEQLRKKDAYIGKLKSAIFRAISYNSHTADSYRRLGSLSDSLDDRAHFTGMAAGMLEANINLKKCITEVDTPCQP